MENEIPICGDGWLAVFDLIAPRQLGLEIALLSHRFDNYVDEHFKTRKWTLEDIRIKWKKGENGTKEMQIVISRDQIVPISKMPVPKKVVGFKQIMIKYIDQNVVDFLRLFCRTFASCGTYLNIISANNGALEFAMHNIWPLIKNNICGTAIIDLRQMRKFVPSILTDCPSLRLLRSFFAVFPAFPSDDSVNATDGQLVAKWLFSPPLLLDGFPKVLYCVFSSTDDWSLKVDGIKAAFVTASSSANFIIVIRGLFVLGVNVPFELTNELTGERFTLKKTNDIFHCLLIRCPISRDEQKWAKWEEEARQWRFDCKERNRIVIKLNADSTSESDDGTEVMTDDENVL